MKKLVLVIFLIPVLMFAQEHLPYITGVNINLPSTFQLGQQISGNQVEGTIYIDIDNDGYFGLGKPVIGNWKVEIEEVTSFGYLSQEIYNMGSIPLNVANHIITVTN